MAISDTSWHVAEAWSGMNIWMAANNSYGTSTSERAIEKVSGRIMTGRVGVS